MALTVTQLTDMRRDLGIGDDGAVFTDPELNRLYERAGGTADDYPLAVAMALRQLMVDAAKLNDYTAGSSSEKKSQVFAQLKLMYKFWAAEAGGGLVPIVSGTITQDFMEPAESTSEYG